MEEVAQTALDTAVSVPILPARILARLIPCSVMKMGTAISAGFMAVNPVFWILPLFIPIIALILLTRKYKQWGVNHAFILAWLTIVFIMWFIFWRLNQTIFNLIRGAKKC